MTALIKSALQYQRTVLLLLLFFMIAGVISYVKLPKEAAPDISIPMAIVSVHQRGITPQDAESLLVKPLEAKLKSLQGLKQLTSKSFSGGAHLMCEFYAGLNIDKLIQDVRTKVDLAKNKLPKEADDPIVDEVNISLFPILAVQLSGNVPLKDLYRVADQVQDRIESLSSVMEAPIKGKKKEVLEVLLDPLALQTYRLDLQKIFSNFTQNHKLIESGSLIQETGSFPIKVPGLLKTPEQLLNFPISTDGKAVLTYQDIGTLRSTYEDPVTFARSNGKQAVVIEVKKRIGENIIETVQLVRDVVAEELKPWDGRITATFSQDESNKIKEDLMELQNSILSAVILVMLVIVFSLGGRSALLVGLAIPGAFLMSLFFLKIMGITLNIVVLFSLILSVGMLVDGAIIVVEYADRKMYEGQGKFQAYQEASIRMAWPVISSLLTVIVVFLPLLFWPGLVGEFMKYMPLTLIVTLTSSLFMALVFIPTLGTQFGAITQENKKKISAVRASEEGDLEALTGFTGGYVRVLTASLKAPWRVISLAVALLVGVFFLYKHFNNGVEFFPRIDTDRGVFLIHARGNLSIYEKDKLVRDVEKKILQNPNYKTVYTTVGKISQASEDAIGRILVELIHWQDRKTTSEILEETLQEVNTIPGVVIEVNQLRPGPNKGKPINIQIISKDKAILEETTKKLRSFMETLPDLKSIEDTRPLPGIEWRVHVDRKEAARFNQTVGSVGVMTQMLTKGFKIGEYRPESSRDEVNVVLRFPEKERTLNQLMDLRVPAGQNGLVPLVNFAQIQPGQKIGMIHRVNGKRYYEIQADVVGKALTGDQVQTIKDWIKTEPLSDQVKIIFKGEEDDKAETSAFLLVAFVTAIFLILLILVTQFNHVFNAALVLTSIIFSTIGVLIGLMVTGLPFGIVMGGLGVIALGGIIVSNNIIFIDTYEVLKKKATTLEERRLAILRTGAQRLRPVILTKLTTILGLLPIRLRLDINFIEGMISYGGPSTEWWIQLSNAIIFGVLFASPLTLLLTPCVLYVKEKWDFRNT